MKELDEIMERYNACYTSIQVEGKEYPGNNPYLLNKINNLLMAGTLKAEDISFGDSLEWITEKKKNGIFHPVLYQMQMDIYDEISGIKEERQNEIRDS